MAGLEAEVLASAGQLVNLVDLGAIQIRPDWLLIFAGQKAVLDIAVLARARNIPGARLRAWLDHAEPIEIRVDLTRNKRFTTKLSMPIFSARDRGVLRVVLVEGARELWSKEISTDGRDSTSTCSGIRCSLNQASIIEPDLAWDPKLQDVVIFLPNGSRYVFWRGASYCPFWAWPPRHFRVFINGAETIHPEDHNPTGWPGGSSVEPLADKELRYGRVRIRESTPSRVHVRWTYQGTTFEPSVA